MDEQKEEGPEFENGVRQRMQWLGEQYRDPKTGQIKRRPLVRQEPKVKLTKKQRRRLKKMAFDGIMAELNDENPVPLDTAVRNLKDAIYERLDGSDHRPETVAERAVEAARRRVARGPDKAPDGSAPVPDGKE